MTCFSTFLLIFIGGLVKSTESGLAVPDWPLSYGMVFPPMVGGVLYEHGHRMAAAAVGFMTLCLAVALEIWDPRRWIKGLAWTALGMVVAQGILGGITVLFFLPTPVSVAHGVLAQTFFVLTIILAYSLSVERIAREGRATEESMDPAFLKFILWGVVLIYLQLIAGAVMRHTEAGLAIPDFPTMGGYWLPPFNETMLAHVNARRFQENLDFVTMPQVVYHFCHRLGALILTVFVVALNVAGRRRVKENSLVRQSVYFLDAALLLQIVLGILTVLTRKEPYLTSVHVAMGAGVLGLTVLLFLRAAPLSIRRLKDNLCGGQKVL